MASSLMAPPAVSPSQNTFSTLKSAVLLSYVFLLFSRTLELATAQLGVPLYLVALLSGIGLIIALPSGSLVDVFGTGSGRAMFLFCCWLLITVPFSEWRRGSLTVIQNEWSKSFLAFLVISGLAVTFTQVRKVVITLGVGGLGALLAIMILSKVEGGRGATELGSFENANTLAFHLVLALPFMYYLMLQSRRLFKVPLILGMLFAVAKILQTGSRGGLILLGTAGVMLFFHVRVKSKIIMLAVAAISLTVAVPLVPSGAWARYATLFDSEPQTSVSQESYDSANMSRANRQYHLLQSIELSLRHPFTGVGIGVFRYASADLSKANGEKARWADTHNAYTQISSEAGIPALILFLSVIFFSFRSLWRAHWMARARSRKDVEEIAFCLLTGLTIFVINGVFTSNAYDYYLPMLVAIITQFSLTAPQELATGEIRATKSTPRPILARPPRTSQHEAPAPQGSGLLAVGGTGKAVRGRNPYRMGGLHSR